MSFFESYNHNLYIDQNFDDGDIVFRNDNGSGGKTTYMTIDGGDELIKFSKGTKHSDNIKAIFGNGSDLQIYHDGSNSIIDNNTNDLIIRCDSDDIKILAEDDIVLRDNDDTTNFIHCINGGSVKLYHNGSEKFETTSTGGTNPSCAR